MSIIIIFLQVRNSKFKNRKKKQKKTNQQTSKKTQKKQKTNKPHNTNETSQIYLVIRYLPKLCINTNK